MTEDQEAKDSPPDSSSKQFLVKAKDKKTRSLRPLTKIILRRLPPTMTEESFLEQVSPIPEHDHIYFAKPDVSLGNNVYSRAYINFVNVDDIFLFRDKFDGYVFLDEKGVEYVGIVEYAPFQRIPKKKKKKDPKCKTIESDPMYQEFFENLSKVPETENQPKLEYSYPVNDGNDKKCQSTPLLEYLAARKLDKRGRDERRRRENDKRKMRIERKTKEPSIKKSENVSEDEMSNSQYEYVDNKKNYQPKFWFGEQRVYHKSKVKYSNMLDKTPHGSDELISTDSDWDSHFPALSMKTHNTFTISSGKLCDKEVEEANQKSGGDTCVKEEDNADSDVKKVKPRDWEKDKYKSKDEYNNDKDIVNDSKSYREKNKDDDPGDSDKSSKKKEKPKESPREQKSKKYSDTRKERLKSEISKDKPTVSKESKPKFNHDDIKPFTQLPQVKTDNLSKVIDAMDKKLKLDENESKSKLNNPRPSSFEEEVSREDWLVKQKSFEERSKSSDREDSEEKDKDSSNDRRTERRIRNKDRPSLVIYQPGMGKFSKQRINKDKDGKVVSDSEKKDT